jgi:peptide/nickel transport system permease protein
MSAVAEQVVQEAAPRRGRRATLVIGLVLTGLTVLTAVVSLFWLPYPLTDISGGRLETPSATHLLGTDRLGRDLLSQLMTGARIALLVGIGAVALAAVLGTLIGVATAFARPWIDDTVSAALDVVIAFPVLLLAMLVVAVQGASLGSAILAIGLAMSAVVARLARILARRVLNEEYIVAARTSGTGTLGLVARHLLPNIAPTLVVSLALQFGIAVLAEASLSYLGLGAPPPNASWGRMLQEAQGTVLTAPVGALAPGIAIVLLVVGVNFLADGLRDVADPTRLRRTRGPRQGRGPR